MIRLIQLLLAASVAADSSPVHQVDHVVIGAADPAPLFAFFADTLKLPIAWALQSFGPYRSGGVTVGNINIEIGRGAARPGVPLPRVASVVFEPIALQQAMSLLRERDIALTDPSPYGLEPNAPLESPGWTTVTLRTLSDARLNVVLCEYVRPNAPKFRAEMTDSLRARGGGVLGVTGAGSLIVGTGGDSAYMDGWRRFIAGEATHAISSTEWRVAGGPHLRFDASRPRGAVAIVLRVASLEQARRELRTLGVATTQQGAELVLDPMHLQGIEIRLTEQ